MTGLLYALLTCFAATFGARDQALVLHLGAAQGRRPALLVTALLAAAASSALAGWIGGRMLAEMAPAARALFGSLAVLLAGGEMLVLAPRRAPAEPTNSLFAALLVIAALQITDAARFLVLALAVSTAAPIPVAMGGAAGSMAALAFAWFAPDLVTSPGVRLARRGVGGVLLVLGLVLAAGNVIGISN